MLRRCLVANRGEIAVRIIRACHELGIEAVAVHSTADKDAMHVRMADHAVQIGPPQASESYLRVDRLISAALTTGCDSIHPGYGFLSESTELVRACAEHDLVWVGPAAEVIETMGDKAVAKDTMRAAGELEARVKRVATAFQQVIADAGQAQSRLAALSGQPIRCLDLMNRLGLIANTGPDPRPPKSLNF